MSKSKPKPIFRTSTLAQIYNNIPNPNWCLEWAFRSSDLSRWCPTPRSNPPLSPGVHFIWQKHLLKIFFEISIFCFLFTPGEMAELILGRRGVQSWGAHIADGCWCDESFDQLTEILWQSKWNWTAEKAIKATWGVFVELLCNKWTNKKFGVANSPLRLESRFQSGMTALAFLDKIHANQGLM